MTTIELITELRRLGIQLWVDQGRLRYRAPEGAMSDALRARIQENRDTVVRLLTDAAAAGTRVNNRIRAGARGQDAPLSFSQERMWFINELERDAADNPYVEASAYRIRGDLDTDLLRRALSEVVGRHDILRTVYPVVDGAPVQRVLAVQDVELPVVDVRACHDAEVMTAVREAVRDARARPLDLAIGPTWWFRVLRFADDDYVLIATMHHIVGDAWSREVLGAELLTLYDAMRDGKPSPLPDLEVQYADFARWQRTQLDGDNSDAQLRYWRERLADVPRVEIPRDHPQSATRRHTGAERHFHIDKATTAALRELAKREGTTLFVTLAAAFTTLLRRYTGQSDIVLATEVANRNNRQTEPLIGMLVNQLVLRVDLAGDPTFREVLRRVEQVMVGAQENQDLPFERLVEDLRPDRDLGHQPLVQVTFSLDNVARPTARPRGLSVTRLHLDYNTQFDLGLFLNDRDEVVEGPLAYDAGMFDEGRIVRLLDQYSTLLGDLLVDPDRPVSALRVLPDDERDLVLRRSNDTARTDHPAVPVHETFERRADLEPDRVAIVHEEHHLTYRALDEAANRLAHRLIEAGVVTESLVGIYLRPSPERVIAALAILKAGGSLLFVDPAHPVERVRLMLRTANLRVLLTTTDLDDDLPGGLFETIPLDVEERSSARHPSTRPAVAVHPEQLQYAIYTSGTTGLPKRIGVPHTLFHNVMAWQESMPGLRGRTRTLQFSTFGFCVSFQEIHTTLAEGGTLVMAPNEVRTDATRLIELLRAEAIERLFLPFGALKMFAQVVMREGKPPVHLRAVATAGEPLQVTEDLAGLFDLLPGCRLHNQYGASETHIVTSHVLSPDPSEWPVSVPIGTPTWNNRIYLLDAALQPVPIGVPGELYVSGAGVPRGYLDEPAMTSVKMVADPFVPGARMYRTGDLARREEDGTICHLGRSDHQIKVRGFRVELGEIAATLRAHALVADVAVVPAGDGEERRLIAYVVPARPTPDLAERLWIHSRRSLPRYMVPAAFVELAGLPLNANGKLDHPALPVPALSTRFSEHPFVAPRSELEDDLAAIWRGVLGVDRVGVHDNFFDLGGHSLPATRVMFLIAERLGADVPVRALFEDPTIAGLAVRVVEAQLAESERAGAERVR